MVAKTLRRAAMAPSAVREHEAVDSHLPGTRADSDRAFGRGRARDFRTGKKHELMRTVRDTDAAGAYKHLQEALDEVRGGSAKAVVRRTRFSEYAASLFELKVLTGEVESAQTRENWELMLRLHRFPAWGDVSSTRSQRWTSRRGLPARRRG
jgi:hypothetical protein